jgi:hypothetical protein
MYDAWVVNPCGESLRAEPHDYYELESRDWPAWRSLSVPPNSTVEIEDAFSTSDRKGWFLTVIGVPHPLPENPNDWKDDTLELPETICDTAYHPPAPS